MSKHQKEVRRERMKAERGRRRRSWGLKPQAASLKPGAAALAAAAAIAAGTSAYANPVRFDNPAGEGHFDWVELAGGGNTNWLDIMLDAGSQPGTPWGSACLRHFNHDPVSTSTVGTSGGLPIDIEVGGLYGDELMPHAKDALIPSGLAWRHEGYAYYAPYGSQLPEGIPTYLGVRFDLGGGYQYGWIGVVRTVDVLDAFAWGYETEPGVAIPAGAVPEPGTLAMLALGAIGVLGRRR